MVDCLVIESNGTAYLGQVRQLAGKSRGDLESRFVTPRHLANTT
jgi:hypothetical protein